MDLHTEILCQTNRLDGRTEIWCPWLVLFVPRTRSSPTNYCEISIRDEIPHAEDRCLANYLIFFSPSRTQAPRFVFQFELAVRREEGYRFTLGYIVSQLESDF